MASVRKRSTKAGIVYQACWRERGRSCAKNFATAKEAKNYAASKELLVERRSVGDPEGLTVEEFTTRQMAMITETNGVITRMRRSDRSRSSAKRFSMLSDERLCVSEGTRSSGRVCLSDILPPRKV